MNGSLIRRSLALAVALSLGCGLCAHAATLRVPAQYPTIQQAIDASRSGDVVRVAPGTYVETLSVFGKGDLALESEAGPEKTIIDGGDARFVICVASSSGACGAVGAAIEPEESDPDRMDEVASGPSPKHEHTTRIAGFTIRNGQNGIFIRHCRAEIQDNVLVGIGKDLQGYMYGAIYAIRASGAIRRNLIEDGFEGIDVSRPRELRIEDNVVVRNAWDGIDIASAYTAVRRVFVLRNVVSHNAMRGMHIDGTLDILAEDNLIVDNGPSVDSVLFNGGEGSPISGRFVNNTIVGPGSIYSVVEFAGAVSGLEVANNMIYSQGIQPAIDCGSYDAMPQFHHDDAFSDDNTEAVSGYCVDGYARGEGDLSVDPRFAGGDRWLKWQPAPDSPLIDAGSNDAARGLRRDFRFRPRVIDGGHGPVVDIGAFEFRARH